MSPATRRSLFRSAIVVALVLVCLLFRRVSYRFELALLELRYFGWLLLILAVGGWLVLMAGKNRD